MRNVNVVAPVVAEYGFESFILTMRNVNRTRG